MIVFVLAQEHFYTVAALRRQSVAAVEIMSTDAAILAEHLRPATYIFADFERCTAPERMLLATVCRRLRNHGGGFRILNDPARVMTRFELLRRLHESGLNSFDVYHADERPRPRRWPVFIRADYDHRGRCSPLIAGQAELDAAIDQLAGKGHPRGSMMVVEYHAGPDARGRFRKHAVFRVGERLLPMHCLFADEWMVKRGSSAKATDEELALEKDFIATNPHAEHLRRVFDMAAIQYGRVDYAVIDGRIEVYEINTNPNVKFYTNPDTYPRRSLYMKPLRLRFLEAMRAIDTPSEGAPIRLAHPQLAAARASTLRSHPRIRRP